MVSQRILVLVYKSYDKNVNKGVLYSNQEVYGLYFIFIWNNVLLAWQEANSR